MFAATPTSDYISLRSRTRDANITPSFRAIHHSTPPRLISDPPRLHPMLTPSPLKRRANEAQAGSQDPDDIFLQSPFRSPITLRHHRSSSTLNPQPIPFDDDEGSIFLTPSANKPFSPLFPSSSSQTLRTPVKQAHRVSSRTALRQLNATPVQSSSLNPATRVAVGTKRKSANYSTPLRQNALTPLAVTTPERSCATAPFGRLAPLSAPRFNDRTPQSKTETESYLRNQTRTMTDLRITDLDDSGEDDDFGLGFGDDAVFLGSIGKGKGKRLNLEKPPARHLAPPKDKTKEEVAEAISPGGHVTKRRARSRPVSLELLESVHLPIRSPRKADALKHHRRPSHPGSVVAFPRATSRTRVSSSSSSSSELGSPLPRRRTIGVTHPPLPKLNVTATTKNPPPRAPLNRLESAGTLFFGPLISPKNKVAFPATAASPDKSSAVNPRSRLNSRLSFASTASNPSSLTWTMIQERTVLPSPKTSPLSQGQGISDRDYFDEQDMFFGVGPVEPSFKFNLTENTPSPRKPSIDTSFVTKFKPRDSGVVLTDDEELCLGGDLLNVMPQASTSVSSIYSDVEDGLVTPGVGASPSSGWPESAMIYDDRRDRGNEGFGRNEGGVDVDAFILRTLEAGTKQLKEPPSKKMPGTPVKKARTTHLATERPWQSAVATKVGLGFEVKGKPRKSLPAAFPIKGARNKTMSGKLDLNDTDSEEGDESPIMQKAKQGYGALGLGRPSGVPAKENHPALARTRWLTRRSSSGAFSSGGESLATPTRFKGKDWNVAARPLTRVSPLKKTALANTERSASGSSSSSGSTMLTPTRHPPNNNLDRPQATPEVRVRRQSEFTYEEIGRFERDFVGVDELGSGEFGKVLKVRTKKGGVRGELFAVKKSKRFEGVRHRHRLREEVTTLQHLSKATAGLHHPNVLSYVDSWEEGEALYIRTELCELGNFARFLWEYGRVFPRLDEARVWKIIADLSNGLDFIHGVGVIHLDIKPANIFVTREGRFKIGDFGMASLWPRPVAASVIPIAGALVDGFEREGDKLYLAPEILQGRYGKAADIFSLGMTMLETASNIVVPDQGEPWHRLRQEDFGQVDLDESPELFELIKRMMRTDPGQRIEVGAICEHPVVSRARSVMDRTYNEAVANSSPTFAASPLAGVSPGFLEEILGRAVVGEDSMDLDL